MNQLGVYYLHIFYPPNLFLEEKSFYPLEFENKKAIVLVTNHLRSLIINDFSNKVVKETDDLGSLSFQPLRQEYKVSKKSLVSIMDNNNGDEAYFILDYQEHLHKEIYQKNYTEIIISFEGHLNEKNLEFGKRLLKYFIDSYRVVSNDILTLSLEKMPYVSKIIKEYFYPYSEEDMKLDEGERLYKNRSIKLSIKEVLFPFWNTDWKTFTTDPKKNSESLKNFFIEKKEPDNISDFIMKAKEELYIHANYKYSFIESWTALEISIVRLLRKIKLEKGISKKKIDDFESEVGISYLLNIELPLIFSLQDADLKELITKVDAVRKLRNKVIHESREISQEDAVLALNTAIAFLNKIEYKKY